jgi:hypothetical protein
MKQWNRTRHTSPTGVSSRDEEKEKKEEEEETD